MESLIFRMRSFRNRIVVSIENLERGHYESPTNERTLFVLISIFIALALLVALAMGIFIVLGNVQSIART